MRHYFEKWMNWCMLIGMAGAFTGFNTVTLNAARWFSSHTEVVLLGQPTGKEPMSYPYELPALSYKYNALEPYIDERTMMIHYTKHHQAYIDNLNNALKSYPELQKKPLLDLLKDLDKVPEAIRTIVRNNGGGHLNHTLFWTYLSSQGGGEPIGTSAEAIKKTFGSFEKFKEEFNAKAKSVFGSGWAWLCVDKNGKLIVIATPNQDAPISLGYSPLLGLDVWEHAYYLKYQNKRPDYITAWWSVVNWPRVEQEFNQMLT